MTEGSADELGHLMAAAQQGDSEAYLALLRRLAPEVRRMVRQRRRFFGDDRIEDIVQDVLLSVHAVRATYDPSRPFLPWLRAITHNRLVDAARRHARGAAHELALDELDVTFSDESANHQNEAVFETEALSAAIDALPSAQRVAIRMVKLQEMSLREAAAASGTSVGALKVAIHRAMKALRKQLGGG
jgi:RNA polymerase sigma-70 factor (ECF subfamily)